MPEAHLSKTLPLSSRPAYRLQTGLILSLFVLSSALLYPYFQYIIDDDGVAYATIARRWATGDFYRAVNGLWSPLHCWLVAPLYGLGLELPLAFKASNIAICSGILGLMAHLLRRVGIRGRVAVFSLLAAFPFCWYMAYCQLAADTLFCLLFLCFIVVVLRRDAFASPVVAGALGLLGGLLYLSKAYGLPLFILGFPIGQWLLSRSHAAPNRRWLLLRNLAIGAVAFLVVALPWITALFAKYGFATYSYAGMPMWKDMMPYTPVETVFIATPHWPDSPTPWEDPYYAYAWRWRQGAAMQALPRVPKMVWHNLAPLFATFNGFSFFASAVLVGMMARAWLYRCRWSIAFLTAVALLPLGYLLLHIEDRFLWPLFFLLLVGGVGLLHTFLPKLSLPRWVTSAVWTVFLASFCLFPINALQDMVYKHREVILLGRRLAAANLHGNFVAYGKGNNWRQIAFTSGGRQFDQNGINPSDPALLPLLRRAGISHLYFHFSDESELIQFRHTRLYKSAVAQTLLASDKLLILTLN